MNSCSSGSISLPALRTKWLPINRGIVLGRQEWLSIEGAEYTATPSRALSSAEYTENSLQNNYTERGGA